MPKETLSFQQIKDQIKGQTSNDQDERTYPAVLVNRAGEQVSTGTYEGEYPGKPGYYLVGVDGGENVKAVTAEELDDAYQAELAEKLAGKPLRPELGEAAVQLASGFVDHIPEHLQGPNGAQPMAEVQPTLEEQVARVDAQINALLEGMSEADKSSLFRYSTYKSDKADAQRRRDGAASTLHGQYMGQEYVSMSPRAQRVATEYHQLMTHLSALRNR